MSGSMPLAIGLTSALLRGGIRFLLLLLIGASFCTDHTDAIVNRDYLKCHAPVGHQVYARESIRDFLAKAAKARHQELDHIRKHVRQLIDFRVKCHKKALVDERRMQQTRRQKNVVAQLRICRIY